MALVKKCAHGRGRPGDARLRAWRRCRCAWVADIRVDGVRRWVNLGPDEGAARAAFAQLQADKAHGRVLVAGPLAGRLGAVLERYLDLHVRGKKRPATVDAYEREARRAAAWLGADTPVDAIRPIHLDELRAESLRRRSTTATGVLMAVVRQALAQAVRDGHLEAVPEPPRAPRVKKPPRVRLGLAECEEVLAALPDDWKAFGELVILTGLRRGELLGLDREDVDLEAGVATVDEEGNVTRYGKGGPKTETSVRVFPLTARAVEILRDVMPESGRVFTATPDQAAVVIRQALKKAGHYAPRRGWHSLRHAHRELLDVAGVSVREAAARMGHGANVNQTERYGRRAEVGEAGPLDEVRARHARPSAEG